MKSNIVTNLKFLVLFFGLISCSPDKSANKQDPQDSVNVEIINSDSTYQRIKDTSQLRADSLISLSLETFNSKDTLSVVNVTCRGTHLNQAVTQESIFKEALELQVKNILPLEVFRPYSGDKVEIRCDFNIETFLNDKKISTTKLKNVQILNSHTFINLELAFLTPAKNNFINRTDLENQSLALPTPEGELQVLCEKTSGFYYSQSDQVSFNDLFRSEIFFSNIEHCRVTYRDQKTQNLYLSLDFKVQNKTPEINFVSFENFMEAQEINDLKNKILARIVYRNVSDFKAYFKLSNLNSTLSFLPIYHSPLRGFELGNAGQTFLVSAEWQIVNPILTTETHSLNDNIYEIMPNDTLTLVLTSSQTISCVTNLVKLESLLEHEKINCNMQIILAGMLFNVSQFPTIGLNTYTDLKTLEFIEYSSLPQPSPIYNEFNLWAPFRNTKNLCSKRDVTEILPQAPVRMDLKNPQVYNCRAF